MHISMLLLENPCFDMGNYIVNSRYKVCFRYEYNYATAEI
jgi:hypothetical protein